MALRRVSLSVPIPEGEPPHRILLLRMGNNPSTQGDFVLDESAVADVLADWKTHAAGNDHPGMIDLEHLSLDPTAPNFDPDSRAWYELAGDATGIWLDSIKWTPDGEARLREKRQRYLSPTIVYDTATRRIRKLINVALTALPALHGAPELIAARKGVTMAQDSSKAMGDILKALGVDPKMPDKVASALGLEAGASIDDIRAALDSFAAKMAKVEELLAGDTEEAAAEEPADTEPAAMAETAEVPVEEEKPEEEVVAARQDVGDELVTLRAFKATVEDKERRGLVAQMVKTGAEDPATAWSDDKATKPAEPWASMSLTALRSRVAKLSKRVQLVPPVTATPGGLTPSQLAICKEFNLEPERFAQLRAQAGR
jgi:hypothetical protein